MDEQQILGYIREELERIKIPGAADAQMETTFEELDADSLDLVELVRALEDNFNVEITDEQLKPIRSVGDAVKLVQELQGASAGA
jgi:acyl carrier protein